MPKYLVGESVRLAPLLVDYVLKAVNLILKAMNLGIHLLELANLVIRRLARLSRDNRIIGFEALQESC